MANRWLPVVPVAFSIAGLGIGLIIMGSQHEASAQTRPAAAPTALALTNAPAPAPTNIGRGEQTIDTGTNSAPMFAAAAPAPAPVTTTRAAKSRPKPGSDENLPSWVPVRGRLTVVEAPDLAENLGLVPKGSTKNAQTRVSVSELLDKPAVAAAQPVTAQSATWLAANGRMRHGRSRR